MGKVAPDFFDARTMTAVVNKRPVFPGLFKNIFFNSRKPIDSKFSELEVVVRGKKLIPFVDDGEAGTVVGGGRREVHTVKTPRLRPKMPFSASKLLDESVPGASPYKQYVGNVAERIEAQLTEDLDNLDKRIELTLEYMCAKALTGSLDVVQENVAFSIDFRMPAEHKIVLAEGSRWTDNDVKPLDDLEDWATDLIGEGSGLGADTCVMGANVWKTFYKNADIREQLDNRRIDLGHLSPRIGKHYKGSIGGVDFYTYGGTYEDANGDLQKLLDPNSLILGSSEAENEIDFGLIEDLANWGEMQEKFSKSWEENDPSELWVLIESRPLPKLRQPDAFVHATVVNM